MNPATAANYFAAVARDWIGVTREHPRRVISESGWSPDPSDPPGRAFCTRCASSVGIGEFIPDHGCAACRLRRFPWKSIIRLGPYREPLRDWIHAVKFSRWDAMGIELGQHLGRSLLDAGIDADLIVPMPMTFRRRWRRGLDHAAVIALGVSRATGWPRVPMLRRSPRPPQWAVPPSARRDNVRHSIRPRLLAASISGARVIVVDDISTSRSTLIEACRAVRAAGAATVTAAVLAVPAPSDRPGAPVFPSMS